MISPTGKGSVYLGWENPLDGPRAFAKDDPDLIRDTNRVLATWSNRGWKILLVSKEQFQDLWPNGAMPAPETQ